MVKSTTKRKREAHPEPHGGADADPRITDPYCTQLKPCRLSDHQQQRKKSKNNGGTPTLSMIKNCALNPNCLYGLGEYQQGIWQGKKLMGRLLGDDPRDLLRGQYPSTNTAATAAVVFQCGSGRQAPCGLRNLGATCYLNSMLQCLFINRPFRKAVYDWEPKQSGASEQQIMQMRALQRLFAAMQLGNKNMYDPQEFASTLSLNSVMQQDAQEFSKLLLAHLRGIFLHSRVGEHTELVDRLFQGQMNYVTKCLRCNNKSSRPSSYYEISLNIKGHKTVERCIESYLAAELLDGDNKYLCDVCGTKENVERFIQVDADKLPPVLTLQLMRFVYDAQAGRKKKLMDVIEVGETLNMTDILRRCGNAQAFDVQEDAVYRLSGYLNHRGKSAHVGHYTASVAYAASSSGDGNNNVVDWFEFDDSVVKNMTVVVDTEGAQEHHGKVIRSRDAYMLIYTRVNDPVMRIESDAPSQLCLDEINVWNTDFATEVAEYEKSAQQLEARMEERRDAYKTFFEENHPFVTSDSAPSYWVDSEWLASWVSGEEFRGVDAASRRNKESDAATAEETSADAEETKTDGTDSDEPRDDEGKEPMDTSSNGVSGVEDDTNVPSEAPGSVDGIPFAMPMDISRFCCAHSGSPRDGSADYHVMFSPDNVRNLKRISGPFFEYLQQTCGVAFDGVTIQPDASKRVVPPIFSGKSYRCDVCESAFRQTILEDADQRSENGAELELLKAPTMPGEHLTYFMSRAWISSYKAYLTQSQKMLQARTSNGKAKAKNPARANGISSHFMNDSETTNTLWQCMLNEDIACPHGNLILDKKKYRAVPLDTWLHFSQKFPVCHTFEATATGVNEPCPMCVVDRATNDEDSQKQRAARDEILDRAPLNRLYRRRLHTPSGSFMLNEVFVPRQGSSSSSARKLCLFLVDSSWMRSWRSYVRDIDRETPTDLRCDALTCDHGKLLLPRSLVQVIKGKSVDHSDMDVEFVYPDEMMHLGELYGMPESRFYYGELLPSGQLLWKACTLMALGEAVANGRSIPSDTGDGGLCSESVTCQACEDATEKMYQDERQNFENRIVHVQLLADDQPVPTSVTLADETSSGRRRSRRIKTGSGSTWSIIANANDTVYVLKTKILEETDEYPIRQRLYFGGDVLHDNRTLKEYGIKAGDAVYMRLAEDIHEELAIADDGHEREVGFQDSVFLSHSRAVAAPRSTRTTPSATVWVCSTCTFLNEPIDDLCEMCSSQKAIEIDD